jgi:hypothetical protein
MKQYIKSQKYDENSISENMLEPNSMINKLFLLLQKPALWQRS